MKSSIFLFVMLIISGQKILSQDIAPASGDDLQITNFHTRIGVFRKDSIWNIKKPIKLPTQPTFIRVTIKAKDVNPRLICILSEEIKIYDTLSVDENSSVNFFNLTGGNYDLLVINLNTKQQAKVSFSIEPVFWERWWFSPFLFLVISVVLGLVFTSFTSFVFASN